MDLNKKRLLLNACFISQFDYCPLVWTCHNRKKHNKINRLHEKCIRLIYNDRKSSEIDSSVSVHDRNLRALATEMYKIYYGISPTIINEIFTLRHQTSTILEIGHILILQELELLVMVLRALDILVLRFGNYTNA